MTKYIGSLPQIHLIFFLLRFIINFVLFFSPRQKGGVPVHRPSRPQVLVTSPPNIMKPSEQICRATLLKLLLFKPRVGNNSICPLIKGSNGSHSTAINMWNSYVNQSVYMPLNTFVRQTGQLIIPVHWAASLPIQLPSTQRNTFVPCRMNPVWQVNSKVFRCFSSSICVWLTDVAKAGRSGNPQLNGEAIEATEVKGD